MPNMVNIILTCYECILSYLQLYLVNSKSAKSTDKNIYIIAIDNKSIDTRDICISNTYAINT